MDEKKLAKKAMRGNASAYGQLIEQYKEVLYRTAFLHVKNETTALDMVSETIVRGYENIHKLREPAYFKTWLVRILLNTIMDYYRKNNRLLSMEDLTKEFSAEKESAQPYSTKYRGLAAEAGRNDSIEEKMDLAAALDRLPEKQKSVIILKYYEDMKISEIASVLEMPEGTVKAYLHKGKETLRVLLKEDYLYV